MKFASNHEALKKRITAILGGEYDGETRIEHVEVYRDGGVVVQLAALFHKESAPKNFIKKNRNLLILDLHFTPSNIQVEFLGKDANKNEVNSLTERELKINLGDFSYFYTADKIEFSGFRTQDRPINYEYTAVSGQNSYESDG